MHWANDFLSSAPMRVVDKDMGQISEDLLLAVLIADEKSAGDDKRSESRRKEGIDSCWLVKDGQHDLGAAHPALSPPDGF